jgi:large subunit ribosomal protein L9
MRLLLYHRVKYNKKGEVMRVIFLEDVPNVARAGDIKEVANGYGRNYLIPQKLARLATSPATSLPEIQRKLATRNQSEEALVKLANQLEGREVTLKARVGAKDRLYGSITTADIAAELQESAGVAIDKRKIELAEPIRQLGSYEVVIRLAKDIVPTIKVTVTAEEKE